MSIVGEPSKRSTSEMMLEFGDPDLEGLKFPQDDPLVIAPIIGNFLVMRVLVENGASVDILFHDTFLRMSYNDSKLTPFDALIYKFNQVECQGEGAIQLSVPIGEEPGEATEMLNFRVVKAASTYNAVMGRTGIHTLKVVPSTYHMVLKFPTKNGVGEAKGDKKMSRSCYVAALRPDRIGGKIDTLIDATDGHEMLSFMDGFSGYNHIKMHKYDTPKVSFITNFGVFCYLIMDFGLKNVGATYQRLVIKIFARLIEKTMKVYVDDMLVKSLSKADHINHLREAFEVLRHHKMMLNPIKCAFGVGSGKFLGHMASVK
ncbi:uncharacterized protein LOC141685929 [Apium graveolens]|uniref:uncharacterized protein LOC141660317 n=1 Tax=Apium graveolens TaxID=4045 RepID=UPI003D7B0DEB